MAHATDRGNSLNFDNRGPTTCSRSQLMAQQPNLSDIELDRLMNLEWSDNNTVAREEQHVDSRAPGSNENVPHENAPHENAAYEDITETSNA